MTDPVTIALIGLAGGSLPIAVKELLNWLRGRHDEKRHDLTSRVTRLEEEREIDAEHIDALEDHIWQQLPPPPPKRPKRRPSTSAE